MRILLTLALCFTVSLSAFGAARTNAAVAPVSQETQVSQHTEKLTFWQKTKLKVVQKALTKAPKDGKKKHAEIEKGLYIVLAIFGLGWLGMGLNDDFEGSDWLISLLLYALLFLPGFIYTLIKMKKYY